MPLNFKSNIDTFHVPYFNIIITSSVDLSASEHKNPFCIPLPYTKMFRRTAVFSLLLWGDMPSTVNNRYSNHVFLLFVPYIHTGPYWWSGLGFFPLKALANILGTFLGHVVHFSFLIALSRLFPYRHLLIRPFVLLVFVYLGVAVFTFPLYL